MTIDKRKREQLSAFCSQLQEDDGVDPRQFFKHPRNRDKRHRKTRQLCCQVAETIGLVLTGECADELLHNLLVVGVTPAPDSSQLLVTLRADLPADQIGIDEIAVPARQSVGTIAQRSGRCHSPSAHASTGLPGSGLYSDFGGTTMMKNQLTPNTRIWTADPPGNDIVKSLRRIANSDDVRYQAVMPDVHLAHDVCVGTAVATSELLYPAAIGGDIGCGMAAIRVDARADLMRDERATANLLSGLYQHIPLNRQGPATAVDALPAELASTPLSDKRLEKLKQREGRVQFGTLGRGNHFLEFQRDQEDDLWVMVHSGSRAMGQAITTHHLQYGRLTNGGLIAINGFTAEGQRYLHDMAWAIGYARLSRLSMLQAVDALWQKLFSVGLVASSLIDTQHNHVQRETHFGADYWVHRKGAQSARQDEPGIIAGSMGTASFHVIGRGQPQSLCSSSHGAGRRWSRSESRRRVSARSLRQQMGAVWYDQRKGSQLCDEAPRAYKDIYSVMRAQRDLTRILRELHPQLVYKG